jgi:hypothetical protein
MSNICFVHLAGGLGNQLFQVAAGYAHSKEHNLELKIHPKTAGGRETYWDSWLHAFADKTGYPPLQLQLQLQLQAIWREPCFSYTAIPRSARTLIGYYQSSKYFTKVAGNLRTLFHPGAAIETEIQRAYADLLMVKSDYAVIHIRRGDYVCSPEYHGILDENYYERAVQQVLAVKPGLKFLIFSDDLPWCRTLSFFPEGSRFIDEPNDVRALYLMAQFQYYVLSNSSFSWWAAWLGTPAIYVLAPKKWFGPKGPQDFQDIYEPSWDRLNV